LPEGQSPVNGRVYVYKLGGSAQVPPPPYVRIPTPQPPAQTATAEVLAKGNVQYMMNCGVCHGISVISGGVLPDLRRSGFIQNQVAFEQVVLKGSLRERGMIGFEQWLTPADVEAIRAYIIKEAWPVYRAEQAAAR
jgi:mono/diheme cytochrome c family protein